MQSRNNSIEKYDFFLKNSRVNQSLEEMIKRIIKRKNHATIMDVGCGNCNALKELKQKFKKEIFVIGVDSNNFKKENIDKKIIKEFLKAKLTEFHESVDLMTFFRSAHLIANAKKTFDRIIKLLSLNGKAILLVRVIELKNNDLSFAGKQSIEDINFWLNLKKTLKINKKKFSVKKTKHYIDLTDLFKKEEFLTNKTNEKLLSGLTITIKRIR